MRRREPGAVPGPLRRAWEAAVGWRRGWVAAATSRSAVDLGLGMLRKEALQTHGLPVRRRWEQWREARAAGRCCLHCRVPGRGVLGVPQEHPEPNLNAWQYWPEAEPHVPGKPTPSLSTAGVVCSCRGHAPRDARPPSCGVWCRCRCG